MADERNRRKTRVGVVVSNKMDKTVVVAIEDFVRHSLYGKAVKRTKKVKAHDEMQMNATSAIKLELWRRDLLSKDKRWRLVNIVEKAK
jgi:small subunit ribosomal protein S17